MFNLDPGKLIVIAVVAIILLGPDKLPQFARQVGGAWRSFNDFRHRMESEVRSSMPDLPPTSEIARLARSPSALLHHLSTMPPESTDDPESTDATDEAPDGSYQPPVVPGAGEGAAAGGDGGADAVNAGSEQTAGEPVDRVESADTGGAAGGTGTTDAVAPNGASSGANATSDPATNGRPPSAPQPAEVAVPADPTLN